MITLLSRAVLIFGVCCSLLAQGQSSPATPEKNSASGTDSETKGKRSRTISSGLSSSLSAGISYQPPPPPKEEEDADLRETDKPKNGIIRLPKYIVEGERPPVFKERDLYTKKELGELAAERYLSSFHREILSKWRVGALDKTYAMMSYEADERRRNMADTSDKIYLYRQAGDEAAADSLQKDYYNTYLRRSDITTQSEEDQLNGRMGVQKNY